MQKQNINYETAKSKYTDINSKFKRLTYLTTRQKNELFAEISNLNSFLKTNPEMGKKLEKEMEIIYMIEMELTMATDSK